MIKKLLSTAALCAAFVGAFAQNNERILTPIPNGELKVGYSTSASPKQNSNNTVAMATVQDTLEYFFNKHLYRNAASAQFIGAGLPFSYTSTPITHIASKFLNSANVMCTGAEALVARDNSSTTNTLSVKLRLCLLSGGYPLMPGIDSLTSQITTTATGGYFLGGDWINGPHLMTTDFAIVAQNNRPTGNGDTAIFYMTNGSLPTATAASIPAGSKFGEGLSSLRENGTFTTTTGFWGTASIPYQTSSMEYCLSPRVSYTATADHAAVQLTVCPQTAVVYNNTSTSVIGNKQFNFNKFYAVHKPFLNPPTGITDSVYVWNAGDGQGNFYGQSHVHFFNTIGVYTSTLTANIRKTNFANPGPSNSAFADTKNNTVQTILACGGSLGLANLTSVGEINIYPNPSNNGLINIVNLSNECTIELINMLGQTVSKEKTNTSNFTADYSSLAKGTYFLKISSNNEKAKLTKLILN